MSQAGPRTRVVRVGDETPVVSDGSVVTIGAYDGVHRGHRKVLQLVRELADARGLDAACVTFDRHPAQVVRPETAPAVLTGLDHKLELLADTDLLDVVCVLEFDEGRSKESAEDFVHEVLVGLLGAQLVVVGADFHFGHRRGGNVALLERMGADLGFEVIGLGLVAAGVGPGARAVLLDPSPPSPRGRRRRRRGRAARPRRTRCVVSSSRATGGGESWGSRLRTSRSSPTPASPPTASTPAASVAPTASGGPPRSRSVAAPRSTRTRSTPLLEAYLLDFDGDLYGQPAAVQFVERLRGEQRFDSVDDLVAQMHRDVDRARTILTST